ncbi:hypothetical protein ACFFKW_26920, partial [Achromobacter marplatensis]
PAAPARAGGEGRGNGGARDGKPADRPAHAGRSEGRPQQSQRRPESTARPAGNGSSGRPAEGRPAQGRPSGAPRAALLGK